MSNQTDAPALAYQGEIVDAPTIAKVVAPLLAIGATWVVQKGLSKAYTMATGHQPPRASDPDASMRRIMMWAATSAVAVAVVNVVVDRMSAPRRIQV
jgi:type 1 glutamine amidotransferase